MELRDFIVSHFNFWIYVVLMMIGLYAMITKNNLIKKLIGMSIFQTAIILFFVSLGVKTNGGIPILDHHQLHAAEEHVAAAHEGELENPGEALPGGANTPEPASAIEAHAQEEFAEGHVEAINPDDYANPLPHVLMLTAIVVGVATLGVALAITQFIFREYGTLEESEILEKIRSASHG